MTDLVKKTINAFSWTLVNRMGQQGIRFVISLFLARLLMPEQFGLIGMITLFITVSDVFVNGGMGAALVRKQDADSNDYSTVFYTNLVLALITYFILFSAAPFIAGFYNELSLTPIIRVLSITIFINALGIVPSTLFSRDLNIKVLTVASLTGILISGTVGIYMACNGFGVWSLVIQQLVMTLTRNIVFWYNTKWYPELKFCVNSFKDLFSYGIYIFFSQLLDVFFRDIFLLVIGKLYSAVELGFYTRAKSLQELSESNLQATFGRISYLSMLKIQGNPEALKEKYEIILQLIVLINSFLVVCLFVLAEPFVNVVLTSKWLPSVPYIKILCLYGFSHVILYYSMNIFKIKKMSGIYFTLSVIEKIFIIIVLFVAFEYGVKTMLLCQGIISSVCSVIVLFMCSRILKSSFWKQISLLFPCCIYSLFTLLILHTAYYRLNSDIERLVILPLSGFVIYFSLAFTSKLKSIEYCVSIIKRKNKKQT